MATITFQGTPFKTSGELPAIGTPAPAFTLADTSLGDVTLETVAGKTIVLNIFPSIDTPVCAASVRRFNAEVDKLGDAVVVCASADLPFAFGRFCGAEGLNNVKGASDLRDKDFGKRYGVAIIEGALAGLLARAIVVIGKDGKVKYTQLVSEVTEEPNYDAAIAAVKAA